MEMRGEEQVMSEQPTSTTTMASERKPRGSSVTASDRVGGGASLTTTFSIPLDGLTIIAPQPELLSQRNVEAVTGIEARAYLEAIRAPHFPLKVAKLGKLRLVDRAAFVAWVRAKEDADGSDETGADAVLAEVGAERRR
jgi:hypothetical protein